MKFDELDNEELVFVYTLIKEGLDTFDKYIEEGGIGYIVDSPFGKVKVFKEFEEDELEIILSSNKLRLFRSAVSKLSPIIEIIADSDPDLVDRIETMLDVNQQDGDSSKEEDL